jgi:adenylate kinase family enzyme
MKKDLSSVRSTSKIEEESVSAIGEEGEERKSGEEGEEEEQEPEPIIYDDLTMDDIVVYRDEAGVFAPIEGFILVGYPDTEEQAQAMVDAQMGFDKIIYLTDPNEGETLRSRGVDERCHLDTELEHQANVLNLVKETFTEDVVIEINCDPDVDTVFYNICAGIDPMFT